MKQGLRRLSHDSLSEIRDEFERWRRDRPRGTRIPEPLWRAAAEAGRDHGVSRTAQELRLDYYALKVHPRALRAVGGLLPTLAPAVVVGAGLSVGDLGRVIFRVDVG